MQQSQTKRAFLKNLLRYFGFPLAAGAVMLCAFFLLQAQVVKEIRKGTYQILMGASVILSRIVLWGNRLKC